MPSVQTREHSSPYHGQRMSVEAYLALPEEKPYLEYSDGIVLQKAVPNAAHRMVVSELDIELGLYRRRHGGASGPEGRVRLGPGRYRLPDAAYWAPGVPSGDDSLPTLAIEVRSPGESLAGLRAKCREYRAAGVPVAWLIDPVERRAELFDEERDGSPADTLASPHLPGFSLELAALFAALDA